MSFAAALAQSASTAMSAVFFLFDIHGLSTRRGDDGDDDERGESVHMLSPEKLISTRAGVI